MSDPVDPQLPSPPDSRDRPRVGVDEWVAAAEGRMERRRGGAGKVERAWTRLPALLGVLLGLPSRRLFGDYLAIVTLFFLQIFFVIANRGNELSFIGFGGKHDLTGGPNGIANIDSYRVFGHRLDALAVTPYFYASLIAFVVVAIALYLLTESRIGRAWRALREDPLAAEVLGTPVNRLKLLAFSVGAAVAGLTGTLFAGLNTAVFATSFDVTLLITIYAMV